MEPITIEQLIAQLPAIDWTATTASNETPINVE